jgi:chloride channel 3/4/5
MSNPFGSPSPDPRSSSFSLNTSLLASEIGSSQNPSASPHLHTAREPALAELEREEREAQRDRRRSESRRGAGAQPPTAATNPSGSRDSRSDVSGDEDGEETSGYVPPGAQHAAPWATIAPQENNPVPGAAVAPPAYNPSLLPAPSAPGGAAAPTELKVEMMDAHDTALQENESRDRFGSYSSYSFSPIHAASRRGTEMQNFPRQNSGSRAAISRQSSRESSSSGSGAALLSRQSMADKPGNGTLSPTPESPTAASSNSVSAGGMNGISSHGYSPSHDTNVRSNQNNNENVSATDLERAALADGGASSDGDDTNHVGTGPLLRDYLRSTSTIRKDFTTVDWFFAKSKMHRVRRLLRNENKNQGVKGKLKNLWLAGQGWLVLCVVGLCTALSASLIHLVSAWLSDLKGGYCAGHNIFVTRRVCCMDEQQPGIACQAWNKWHIGVATPGSAGAFAWNYALYVLFAIALGTGGSWICVVFARQAAGSGIAELKIVLGGFVIKTFLGIRTLLFKTFGLTLAVASGMSLGKEGPMVHIACAWGNILSRPFVKYATNEVMKREILSASVAAGVTAAFGSPLGGVLFSLEVVSSYFPIKTMWRSFWCAVCAAVMLQWLDPFQTGKLVQFAMTVNHWQWFEIIPFIFLGCVGGTLGALFVKLNIASACWRKNTPWIKSRPVLEVAIIACLTGLIAFPNIFHRGNSGALLANLFTDCRNIDVAADDDANQGSDSVITALCEDGREWNSLWLMLIACAARFFLTTITYGSAIPSGVFMPSLCIGALMGRIMGILMAQWQLAAGNSLWFNQCRGGSQCVNPALYAVIGAAAVLGGITRMTVSLAVIMFEVTGGLETIVPIMVAVVFSKWCGDAIGGKAGLYGRLIELNGLPHIDPTIDIDLVDQAAEFMQPEPVCVTTYGETIESIRKSKHQANRTQKITRENAFIIPVPLVFSDWIYRGVT